MRLTAPDEALLRWYILESDGEHLRSNMGALIGRAQGEIPESKRAPFCDLYSDEALDRIRLAKRVRSWLAAMPRRLSRPLIAAYCARRPDGLSQRFDRLACVVLLLPSAREAYKKATSKKRAGGLPFERWVAVKTKIDPALTARLSADADRLLSEAVIKWRAVKKRGKRSIRAAS